MPSSSEYPKIPMASSRASVRKRCSSARSASVSPGKPTMKLERTPASGQARLTCSSSAQKRSRSPNRRMDRSTRPLACWKDRSKYGTTPGVDVMTSISPGRSSAGCR